VTHSTQHKSIRNIKYRGGTSTKFGGGRTHLGGGIYISIIFDSDRIPLWGYPKKKVVPGFEPGLLDSKSKVLTTGLYNLCHLSVYHNNLIYIAE
jgi:hypothetical protein